MWDLTLPSKFPVSHAKANIPNSEIGVSKASAPTTPFLLPAMVSRLLQVL